MPKKERFEFNCFETDKKCLSPTTISIKSTTDIPNNK